MKQKVGIRQNSPSCLTPGCLQNVWTVSPLLFPRTTGSLAQSASVSQSLSPVPHSVPPSTDHPRGHCSPCVPAGEQRRVAEQLNLSCFLLKATSPSQLRGLSKGCFPLLSLFKRRFRWFLGRKNLSLKDTAQIGGAAIWGHPEAEGNKGQKRLWEPDTACEEEAVAGPALSRPGADTVRGPDRRKALTSRGPQQNQ